jgi:hypothetical protein
MTARQTRDIRIEAVFGNAPINIMSTHPLVDRVRELEIRLWAAGRRVMYCSPHPAALHIAPAARLREFCF